MTPHNPALESIATLCGWKKGSYSGSSVASLMRMVGITNPWGNQGEGYVYAENAYATIAYLNEALSSGDLAQAESRIAEARLQIRTR